MRFITFQPKNKKNKKIKKNKAVNLVQIPHILFLLHPTYLSYFLLCLCVLLLSNTVTRTHKKQKRTPLNTNHEALRFLSLQIPHAKHHTHNATFFLIVGWNCIYKKKMENTYHTNLFALFQNYLSHSSIPLCPIAKHTHTHTHTHTHRNTKRLTLLARYAVKQTLPQNICQTKNINT